MIDLVYETHATSTHNEQGIATGWLQGELSQRGRALARDLGRRRREDGIAAVFTSDLRRAIETAEIAFAESDLPVHEDDRLRECNYGDLNGKPVEQVKAIRFERIDVPFPKGESYMDVVVRTHDFLADLLCEHDGARILLIAHSANRWAIEHLLHGKPLAEVIEEPFVWQDGWEYQLDERALTIL